MTKLKLSLAIIISFTTINIISSQSFSSYLYPIADTVYLQSFMPRIHDNRIYALQATYENGFSGANSIVYIDEYAYDGLQLAHKRIDPLLPQLYQVVNLQPMLWLNDQLLVSTDRITLTDNQRAIVFGFNMDLTNVWTHEFESDASVSTSGILLPNDTNKIFHIYIRSSQINHNDDLSLNILNKNGEIAWTKYTSLPEDQERDYFQVITGAKIQNKTIVLCNYIDLSSNTTNYLLAVLDTAGNLIESKNLPPAGQPLLASQPDNDTFYITETKRVGTHYYYCLNTYLGSINNLINTSCSDDMDSGSSEFDYDMRIDSQGNVYTVGYAILADDSLSIGHLAKWSPSGELIWKKSYRLEAYPQGVSGFSGLDFAPNGQILLSGGANNDHSVPFPLRFLWLLTLDKNGCYDDNCSDVLIIDANAVSTKEAIRMEENNFQVYPNPADTQLTLNCPADGQIRLFDMQGKIILEKSVNPGLFSLPLECYPFGLYFIQFNDGKSSPISRKIIIERR